MWFCLKKAGSFCRGINTYQIFILLTKFTKIDVGQYFALVEDRDDTQANSRFSCDITAAMLVYRTVVKKVFWELDNIIMQNLSDILPLFCTPPWRSHDVSENQE